MDLGRYECNHLQREDVRLACEQTPELFFRPTCAFSTSERTKKIIYGNLYRNTIKDGDSQTCPLPIFPEGVGTSVHRLSPRLPPFFSASIREGGVALSVGHPRGTHSRCVIGCCLIPLGICGLKNNSRRITYGIGCVWGMPSLSPLSSLGL